MALTRDHMNMFAFMDLLHFIKICKRKSARRPGQKSDGLWLKSGSRVRQSQWNLIPKSKELMLLRGWPQIKYRLVVSELKVNYQEMDLAVLKQEAADLGLTDPRDIAKYVQDQQRDLRAERREREDREREFATAQAMREHEIQMAELNFKHKIEVLKATPPPPVAPPKTKLPMFPDDADQVEAYFLVLERVAADHGWDEKTMFLQLVTRLQGHSLDVYHRTEIEGNLTYSELKEALLSAYAISLEQARCRFQEAHLDERETCRLFITRLSHLFKTWHRLSNLPDTKEGILELILVTQLLSSLPKGLRAQLRMNKVTSLAETADIADGWFSAYGYNYRIKKEGDRRQESKKPAMRSVGDRREAKTELKSPETAKSQPGEHKHQPFNMPRKGGEKKPFYQSGHLATVNSVPEKEEPQVHVSGLALGHHVLCACSPLPLPSAANKRLSTAEGLVQGRRAVIMRDSGSTGCVVKKRYVKRKDYTGKTVRVTMIDGSQIVVNEAKVFCQSPYFTGTVTAAVMDNPAFDFVLGNVPGASLVPAKEVQTQTQVEGGKDAMTQTAEESEPAAQDVTPMSESPGVHDVPIISAGIIDHTSAAVTTRAAARRSEISTRMASPQGLEALLKGEDIAEQQKNDATLSKLHEYAEQRHVRLYKGIKTDFIWQNNRLYRRTTLPRGEVKLQFVVPAGCRQQVFKLGHHSLLGGHMGAAKTLARIQTTMFWPGMGAEILRLARSCDICQKTTDKGRNTAAPLQPLPVISEPFSRVAVDIVGPITPCADDKSKYILTIVDFATRWPEAVALKNIEAATVAEALFGVFCRIGIPREVLSDRGTQFTSGMMEETKKLLSVKGMRTTPYHPEGNGLCERFNGTLKKMLKRMAADQPREWPRLLAPLLFAYREAPQSSLKFSPFELVYGRPVRGPLQVLRELWDNTEDDPVITSSYQYVLDLNERLHSTCELAKEELLKSQVTQKSYYDRKAKLRTLDEGDQCLILLPTSTNKLLAQWSGPYIILKRVSDVNYIVGIGHEKKLFHINMIKKYYPRSSPVSQPSCTTRQQRGDNRRPVNVRRRSSPDSGVDNLKPFGCAATVIPEDSGFCQPWTPETDSREGPESIIINPKLEDHHKADLREIIQKYPEIFSDQPRVAKVEEHRIILRNKVPVRTKPYPIPLRYVDLVIKEIKKLEAIGIIEPSKNLTKGFFQIPLHPESRKITAFKTPCGLYQYKVLPFGLTNSPSVFNRCMRQVLGDISGVEIFMDDLLIHTSTLAEHQKLLDVVFSKLSLHRMTLKPSKCEIAFTRTHFLGHTVGDGKCECQQEKIQKIRMAPRPVNQHQLRSFLGLVGYYRSFIKDFTQIALPLFNLLKKNCSNKMVWGAEQEKSFATLKETLCSEPILRLPSKDKPFTLRTDASGEGVGAILLQEFDGRLFPVAYHSRRLSKAECNYSTVERELLAVIEGIHKFYYYLCGAKFTLETDHMPLSQLKRSKTANARLMRWGLYLQQFEFTIRYIRGTENVGADLLSRLISGSSSDLEDSRPETSRNPGPQLQYHEAEVEHQLQKNLHSRGAEVRNLYYLTPAQVITSESNLEGEKLSLQALKYDINIFHI
ncbi:uncharacterized protein LOC119584788 [Penaeus monodon]|uniref:uncharacterized protein LOC119584788 n=1 Tax=Penaeus monodon TaxID=6687 RepID=UPI0018A7D739|nr:uncharacterized protein LOC119584788 [Penaeus monodon]